MQHSNRLDQQLTFQERKRKAVDEGQRKAEVRTKIQLGGLIIKSQLTDLLAITPGDDLQLDPSKWEKAAVILGALVDAYEKLQLDKEHSLYQEWMTIGTKLLKYKIKEQHVEIIKYRKNEPNFRVNKLSTRKD